MTIPPPAASSMLLVLSFAATQLLAQTDGTLDPAFDLDGAVRIPFDLGATLRDVPVAVAVHGDGRIVVLGTAATEGYGDQVALARLQSSGQLDTGFGGIGYAIFGAPVDDFPTKLVAEPDGAVVVAGSRPSGVNPGPELFLDRVSPYGFYAGGASLAVPSLDSPWVGLAREWATGNLLTAFSYTFDLEHWIGVTRWFASLAPDPTYGVQGRLRFNLPAGEPGAVAALELLPGGSLLIVGTAFGTSGDDLFVARATASGFLDPTFGDAGIEVVPLDLVASGNDRAEAVAVDSQGRILIAGSADAPGSADRAAVLVRLTANGAIDWGFNGGKPLVVADTDGDDAMNGVVVQSDGRIVVAGKVHGAASPMFFAARYLENGSADWSFGSFGVFTAHFPNSPNDDYAVALTLQGGRPILVGPAEWSTPDYDFGVMRLASSLIFTDGFERGSAGAWSSQLP